MAIGSVNFSGLMSGLDTSSIVSDLMKVDSQPLRRIENQKKESVVKRDTYQSLKSSLSEFQNKAYELKTASTFGSFSASSSDEEALTVTATSSASAGNYSIRVLSLAQTESISGDAFTGYRDDLNLSGGIVINNTSLKFRETDSLLDIRNAINALDAGVSASILKVTESDYRLILSSETSGEDGFTIANLGNNDILGGLGLVDDTKNVRKIVNGAVRSVEFESANATFGSMLNTSSGVSGTVSIRNKSLDINFSSDTLSTVRDKINDLGLSGVSAAIGSTSSGGATTYRLEITGTQDFTDDGNVLETLGILERGFGGATATFETAALEETNGSTSKISYNTKFKKLSAAEGETITISGTGLDGDEVKATYTIGKNSRVSELLSAIEESFGGDVTASLENGKITVRCTVDGTNDLDFSIRANNEQNGGLDFGAVSTVTAGRDRLLSSGTNARIMVNNVKVTRETNEIADVLTGLSMTLKKADPDTTVNITVENDVDAVKEKVQAFVTAFNDTVKLINANSRYNEDTGEAGPLLGDSTSRTVLLRLRNALQDTIDGGDATYTQLAQVGIETAADGTLSVDSAALDEALNNDMDAVKTLFTATRSASDNDVQFVYHSNDSDAGTYDITVNRAAEQAEVRSNSIDDTLQGSGTLTVTDNYGSTMSVDVSGGMSAVDVVNLINDEAETSYAEMKRFTEGLLSEGGGVADNSTLITELSGVKATDGDTITIEGTDRNGRSYQRTFSTTIDEVTVSDMLDAIEDLNDGGVSATIDSRGRIMIEEREAGASSFDISIDTTISGLSFGEVEVLQEGRNEMTVDAALEDGRIVLTHRDYGSKKTFTTSGGAFLGIEDGVHAGVDVAGSINGSTAAGNGRSLTSAAESSNTAGMVVNVSITPEELETEGSDQGTITLISGIADKLYAELSGMTSSVDGYLQVKLDSYEITLDNYDDRISTMNKRLEQRRTNYVRKFTELEKAMARLQSMQQQLSSSLGSLPTTSLFG